MIKKRAHTPGKQSKGRHPMLKPGLAYTTIYNYIQLHPGCTREDITKQLSIPPNRVTGRVADLINEGLINVAGWKVSPYTRKRIQTLEVSGSISGNRNDRLKVRIKVFCTDDGDYYIKANLIGGGSAEVGGKLCLDKTITLAVAPPSSGKLQTSAKDGLILDGDYSTVG